MINTCFGALHLAQLRWFFVTNITRLCRYFENETIVTCNEKLLSKAAINKLPGIFNRDCFLNNQTLDNLGWIFGAWAVSDLNSKCSEFEMELIDAGAEDLELEDDGFFHITTSLEDFGAMVKKLEELKLEPESAELQRIPTDTKKLSIEDALKIMKVIDLFEDDDDVQNVFHNMEITDELMEAM